VDDIIDELSWRGLLADTTDLSELRSALNSGRVTFYAGFDPTAPGLHIGNLALLLTMRRLQLAGHRPIGLVGGATGLIGDPSGKSTERVLNPREVVAQWVERIRGEESRFLDFDAGESSALIVSNLEWTGPMLVLDFLRDIGRHFSVNRMLDRESVKARLEGGGLSFTEFSYQLLQAMDYLELHRRYGCTLQLGGSDQWGNLVGGVELIRRADGASVHALAIPLITKADGTKYGKTEGGAIWLSADLMSPYAFYQFWLNVADVEVPGLLRVYSFKSRAEIEALIAGLPLYSDRREQFSLALYGTSETLKIDGEGRVQLTETLKTHAAIADTVSFVGLGHKFQIWEPGRFRSEFAEATAKVRAFKQVPGTRMAAAEAQAAQHRHAYTAKLAARAKAAKAKVAR